MTACRRAPAHIARCGNGYVRVCKGPRGGDGRRAVILLHRWVVEQVEGRTLLPWPDEIVMHTCDTPDCFLYEHLRSRVTQAENIADCVAKGRKNAAKGERHADAKLTEAQVIEARALYATGATSQRKLAAMYGLSRRAIRQALAGETWKHVR